MSTTIVGNYLLRGNAQDQRTIKVPVTDSTSPDDTFVLSYFNTYRFFLAPSTAQVTCVVPNAPYLNSIPFNRFSSTAVVIDGQDVAQAYKYQFGQVIVILSLRNIDRQRGGPFTAELEIFPTYSGRYQGYVNRYTFPTFTNVLKNQPFVYVGVDSLGNTVVQYALITVRLSLTPRGIVSAVSSTNATITNVTATFQYEVITNFPNTSTSAICPADPDIRPIIVNTLGQAYQYVNNPSTYMGSVTVYFNPVTGIRSLDSYSSEPTSGLLGGYYSK